jgi:hypothetical protein
MPTLDLNDLELALLRMLLRSRLGSLDVEIAHTDTRDYKEMLKAQRQALEALAGKLGV